MIFKKKFFLGILFTIIIIQGLLFAKNNHKTSFRYFKSTINEVSIGKLISISFFSGLFISTILNSTNSNFKKNNFKNIDENNETINNETINSETIDNIEGNKSNIEMPPQRDIRDSQPTISVNYRVVKDTEGNNMKSDQNYSNSSDKKDDWNDQDEEW